MSQTDESKIESEKIAPGVDDYSRFSMDRQNQRDSCEQCQHFTLRKISDFTVSTLVIEEEQTVDFWSNLKWDCLSTKYLSTAYKSTLQ